MSGNAMNVVRIGQHRSQKTIEVLQELIAIALTGELDGFAYVAEIRGESSKFGVLGRYREDPVRALPPLRKLRGRIEEIVDNHEQVRQNVL